MKLSVAANYDLELAPKLQPYPVAEMYGKFPSDFVGGGRPSYMGTPLTRKDLERYVAQLASHGIAFNYLLNGACQGNREWTRRWQKKLMGLLDLLGAMGIQRVTASTPFLVEAVKARLPQFHVKAGLYAMIDTPRRARFWEQLGADTLTLDCRSINRDFTCLQAIRQAVRCDLQLIANHVCLPNCPMLGYHQNGLAHGSDGSNTLFVDYCFFRCCRLRLEDPSLLIKAGWIRPEDIGAYEGMGFTTFKLLERGIPSEELLKRVKAYSLGRFEGNLAEILLPYGFRQPIRRRRFWGLRHFFKPRQISPRWARPFLDLAKSQGMLFPRKECPFHIESSAIPNDFLEAFRTRNCAQLDCRDCGYCERIAERAVTVDPLFRTDILHRFHQAERAMIDGSLWGA